MVNVQRFTLSEPINRSFPYLKFTFQRNTQKTATGEKELPIPLKKCASLDWCNSLILNTKNMLLMLINKILWDDLKIFNF